MQFVILKKIILLIILGSSESSETLNKYISSLCRGCGKVFQWKEHMKVHQQNTKCGIEKLHKCPYCNKIFKWKASVKMHIHKIHSE